MARFIAAHRTPEVGRQAQSSGIAKELQASLVQGAAWLNSWWVEREARKMFCEWEAEREDDIHASLEPVNESFPIESIYPMIKMDPEWYE